MLFFYNRVSSINEKYPVLFNKENEETGYSGDTGEIERTGFADKWGWLDAVRIVSDLVHSPWDIVFKMNVIEFLNLLCYSKDLAAERERLNKELLNKTKR